MLLEQEFQRRQRYLLQLEVQNPRLTPAILNFWNLEVGGFTYSDGYGEAVTVPPYASNPIAGYPLWSLSVSMRAEKRELTRPEERGKSNKNAGHVLEGLFSASSMLSSHHFCD